MQNHRLLTRLLPTLPVSQRSVSNGRAYQRFALARLLNFSLWGPAWVVHGEGEIAVLPAYGSTDCDSFFHLQLKDGATFLTDQLDRNPIRSRLLGQNPYREIGRPDDQPGFAGEIFLGPIRNADGSLRAVLFVETSTGYVAFFEQPGRGSRLGEISVALGRPFADLVTTDGNYALLMRRDGSGRTEGAYLYHATEGKAVYLDGMRKLETDAPPANTSPLPKLVGHVAAVELQSTREETVGFLVADAGDGTLHFITTDSRVPTHLTHRKLPLSLDTAVPSEGGQATPVRLLAVPLLENNNTRHVLFLDVATGTMVLLEDLERRPALVKMSRNLYDLFGEVTSTPRTWSAVPHIDNNRTVGVWVIDGASGNLLYIDNPANPVAVSVRRAGRIGR